MTDHANPFLVLTAIMDATARPAAVTRSHADAMEQAFGAIDSRQIAGIDLVELPIQPSMFAALRKQLERDDATVAVYDLFPLSGAVDSEARRVAGQFLAAEVLWAMDEHGMLGGVPLNIKLDLPASWPKGPKEIHAELVKRGALELTPTGIQTFKDIKTAWDALQRPAQ
jgi:hypothetical protein